MKLSVIMPYYNDEHVLSLTLDKVLEEMPPKESELIIVDDGSFEPLVVDHPMVKVVRLHSNKGVGLSFNMGVEIAKSCNIVLMGCDVIPQEGWYKRVLQDLNGGPSTIYCSVSSGFSDDKEPFTDSSIDRYGAKLLYMFTKKDLPEHSKLHDDPKFSRILQAKWNDKKPGGRKIFANIDCLLGAFYWMLKEDYQKLHGWNGHRRWGSLEPMLSIKAKAHGMDIILDKKVNAAHYYGREPGRSSRWDLAYYNMLFMAHTMFSDALRDELIDYLLYDEDGNKRGRLNVNQAMLMIKRDHGLIQAERDYNNKHFKRGLISNWEKFLK